MINIFGSDTKPNKMIKKTRRNKRPSKQEEEARGKANLDRLNPMAIPLLAVHAKEGASEFLKKTSEVISEAPHRLTEKWINSINNWVDGMVKAATLEEPEISPGERRDFGPLKLIKFVAPKQDAEYPMPAMMLADSRGWKWYFKTSKTHDFDVGDMVLFRATVSGHGEGITFLKRVSNLKKTVFVPEKK